MAAQVVTAEELIEYLTPASSTSTVTFQSSSTAKPPARSSRLDAP
nr:MAG TPA: hypothetical protein [Caudoviricetes sp.]